MQGTEKIVTDKSNTIEHKIVWLSSAYPRAFYYLGFAHVKLDDPAAAIGFLEQGYKLEPHPMFLLERGKALARLKRHDLALASYEAALAHRGSVRAVLRAVALRGKGVQLIELGQLDLAEQAFNDSLELDPNNPVAANELRYIERLRRGGPVAPSQTVVSGDGPVICAICGEKLTEGGKVSNVDGRVVWRCNACAAKLPIGPGSPGLPSASSAVDVRIAPRATPRRAWWQFWKR